MQKENTQLINHQIQVFERKTIKITGVKKIENFDKKEFFLESIMGYLLIKGNNMEIIKLDTVEGTLNINGSIDSLIYLDQNGKKSKESNILTKLFK